MSEKATLEFTGEFFVPGKSGERIEADHTERYRFASTYAANRSVLDIACGAGYSAPLFIRAGAARYAGVDLNEKLIAYATETYGAENVRFAVGNICTFGSGASYDLIACFETIEHVSDYRAALQNLFVLLKPGGTLLISSPNRPVTSPKAKSLGDKPSNEFHVQEFIPSELISALQAAGFAVSPEGVYGQRPRRLHTSWLMRKIARLIRGNPDKTASAAVARVTELVPRYFIIVAKKAG
jgi:SAM-dependent methyltransferase